MYLSFRGRSPRTDVPHLPAQFPISWADGEPQVHVGKRSDLGGWPLKYQNEISTGVFSDQL